MNLGFKELAMLFQGTQEGSCPGTGISRWDGHGPCFAVFVGFDSILVVAVVVVVVVVVVSQHCCSLFTIRFALISLSLASSTHSKRGAQTAV
jgi:hypothetical protein